MELNLPTSKLESWHYTSLKIPANVKPSGFVCDGWPMHENVQLLADKFGPEHSLIQLSNNLNKYADIIEINQENCNDIIEVNSVPRLKIIVKSGVHAQLTTIYKTANKWHNIVVEIVVEKGASLTHLRSQVESLQTIHTAHTEITLNEGAKYVGICINNGAQLSRHTVHANLNGKGANFTLRNLQFGDQTQHLDTTVEVKHNAPATRAEVLARNVVNGKAKAILQGKFAVAQAAQQTDANMQIKSLLLSDSARAYAKPELEIYADDVKCAHGNSSGALDDEALFYMRSRGLNENDARKLLMQSFVMEMLNALPPQSAIYGQAEDLINDWLED